MAKGMQQQEIAVESGYWPLYRYNPARALDGKNPLQLDSKKPKRSVEEFMYSENRFKRLLKINPERAKRLLEQAEKEAKANYHYFRGLASIDIQDSE